LHQRQKHSGKTLASSSQGEVFKPSLQDCYWEREKSEKMEVVAAANNINIKNM
jgi:hypothetical protein